VLEALHLLYLSFGAPHGHGRAVSRLACLAASAIQRYMYMSMCMQPPSAQTQSASDLPLGLVGTDLLSLASAPRRRAMALASSSAREAASTSWPRVEGEGGRCSRRGDGGRRMPLPLARNSAIRLPAAAGDAERAGR
jgi:hypothetical protein